MDTVSRVADRCSGQTSLAHRRGDRQHPGPLKRLGGHPAVELLPTSASRALYSRREAEVGSPSKSTTSAQSITVIMLTATIAGMSRACAARFQGFAAAVRDHVAAAPVKHMDETGFRIGCRWLRESG